MIKVNVVSGFLGAGKTTLIKHLAASLIADNEKVVILENEFGQEGIDGKMLELEGLSVFEIASGCICCTLKNDFMSTLINIADNISPDRILIEPSGIFVLSEIYDIFKYSQVNSRMVLSSSLTVIDCTKFLKQRHHFGYFFENQINYADKLILSKTTDISQDVQINIIEELQLMNPRAEILSGQWFNIQKDDYLGLLSAQKNTVGDELSNNDNLLNLKNIASTKHGKHSFTSFSFVPQLIWSEAMLNEKLSLLVDGSFGSVIRAKGHARCEKGILEFNYVDGTYSIILLEQNIEPSICFIGEALDKEGILKLFGASNI